MDVRIPLSTILSVEISFTDGLWVARVNIHLSQAENEPLNVGYGVGVSDSLLFLINWD